MNPKYQSQIPDFQNQSQIPIPDPRFSKPILNLRFWKWIRNPSPNPGNPGNPRDPVDSGIYCRPLLGTGKRRPGWHAPPFPPPSSRQNSKSRLPKTPERLSKLHPRLQQDSYLVSPATLCQIFFPTSINIFAQFFSVNFFYSKLSFNFFVKI